MRCHANAVDRGRSSGPTALAVLVTLIMAGAGCAELLYVHFPSAHRAPPNPLSEPEEVQLERYPTIIAPDRVERETPFEVRVGLTTQQVSGVWVVHADGGVPSSQRLVLSLPDAPSWTIDVVLSAEGFTFPCGQTGLAQVTLSREGESTYAVFQLLSGPEEAERTLWASFFHEGRYLGKALRPILIGNASPREVDAGLQPDAGTLAAAGFEPDGGVLPRAGTDAGVQTITSEQPPRALQFSIREHQPDLTLWVRQLRGTGARGGKQLEVVVQSRYLRPAQELFEEDPDFGVWLEEQYRRLSARAARSVGVNRPAEPAPAAVASQNIEAARAFGRRLYQHAPPLAVEAIERLQKHLGRRLSIQILTSDPRFPWELLSYKLEDGTWHDFLGIEADVARWHITRNARVLEQPPIEHPVDSVVSIAPQYQVNNHLLHQDEDLKGIPERLRPRIRTLSGTRSSLSSALGNPQGRIGVLHFAGHGEVREGAVGGVPDFFLNFEDTVLSSSDFQGLVAGQRRDNPFVFLNACRLGQEQAFAGTVEGWASAALEVGASGYVGGLWPLGDQGAAGFAQRFYAEAFNGWTVSYALAQARSEFFKNGDPTYLAYVFYGDVDLVLVDP